MLILLVSFALLSSSKCQINLYISNTEMQRILGFDAELYYIRDGVVNWNAIKYELLVSETVDYVKFRWQDSTISSISSPPVVSSSVATRDHNIIHSPTLTFVSNRKIPSVEEEFQINIPCKHGIDGSAFVYFHLNITNIQNQLSVPRAAVKFKFTFNKLCKYVNIINGEEDTDDDTDLYYHDDDDDSESVNRRTVFYVSVALASTVILIVATAIGFLHVHSMPKLKEEDSMVLLPNAEAREEEPVTKVIPKGLKVAIAEERQKELMMALKEFLVRRNLLSIGNTVQEGSFGRAYLGNLINAENGEEMKVLVKTVTELASPEQKTLFLVESCCLKRVVHHNVLPLMHVCFDEGKPPLAIYQYMNRGNLKNYLRLSRTAEPLLKSLTTRDIVLMALQIARGLQYLSRRHIVHKDVATRNCVVDEELHVKVCDNALSRDFFPGDYHCLGDNENRPIRWMAVECLENNAFLPLSDVWSYGVLLWELCSLAQTPYANVDPFEMLTYLKSGLRLPQPLNCPDELFTVMACCWALSTEERPHFTQIIACLDAFFNKLNAFI